MEANVNAAIEIAKKIEEQNNNLKNAIFFLKNITHSAVISDVDRKGDTIGISPELKLEISCLIDKLDKSNICSYDCNRIIEKNI